MTTHFYGDGCTPPHLPDRELAADEVAEFAKYGIVSGSRDAATSVGFDCLTAYADGTLMTRQEFVDSLDMDAAAETCSAKRSYCTANELAEHIVAAALGKEQT